MKNECCDIAEQFNLQSEQIIEHPNKLVTNRQIILHE